MMVVGGGNLVAAVCRRQDGGVEASAGDPLSSHISPTQSAISYPVPSCSSATTATAGPQSPIVVNSSHPIQSSAASPHSTPQLLLNTPIPAANRSPIAPAEMLAEISPMRLPATIPPTERPAENRPSI
ncbi:hypothetical protein U1Q18_018813 [Sarracenia purpurea var. burkii]